MTYLRMYSVCTICTLAVSLVARCLVRESPASYKNIDSFLPQSIVATLGDDG